jgi:hypothetical protein
MHQARRLWANAEALHAVTYFHPVCLDAMARRGTKGFWMAYFVGRMAPMGAVEPAVAEAVAFGFAAERPARALPDGWGCVSPADAVRVRAVAAAQALGALGVPEPTPATLAALEVLREHGRPGGHALGAANRRLGLAKEPLVRLWQMVTWLREQRGDDHVALWVSRGFDGCEANVLTTAVHGQDPDVLRLARAWSAEEWEAAGERLARRGLLDGTSATDAGRAEHQAIEARTDELSAELYARARSADERDALVDDLGRLAAPVLAAGLYPSPNPMGLPVPEPS